MILSPTLTLVLHLALQYDDLDTKQSQSIPSTIHGGHRKNTPYAWEIPQGSEEMLSDRLPKQKISLDFRYVNNLSEDLIKAMPWFAFLIAF